MYVPCLEVIQDRTLSDTRVLRYLRLVTVGFPIVMYLCPQDTCKTDMGNLQ